MLEISEALERIAAHSTPLSSERISLASAVGHRLAQAITTDIDSPPHDKSLMDGFAVRGDDVQAPGARLTIIDTVQAGGLSSREVTAGTAIRIMTGAPLPRGADTVVMVEGTDFIDLERTPIVTVRDPSPVGKFIMRRAQSMRAGQTVFERGHVVRPHDIGVLGEVGCHALDVIRAPRVAVLATGDELVAVEQFPGAAQIRNSNGPMLAALASQYTPHVEDLGIARDQVDELTRKIETGLKGDLLILSGGVSAGIADLVPQVLTSLGVTPVFHKVSIKPGKPIWFGIRKNEQGTCHVFGLPGNPVSTLVCFEVFVGGCWQRLIGGTSARRPHGVGVLGKSHLVRGERPTYWPVRIQPDPSGANGLWPLNWQGSSDLKCLSEANGLGFFPPRATPYEAGETIEFLALGGVNLV